MTDSPDTLLTDLTTAITNLLDGMAEAFDNAPTHQFTGTEIADMLRQAGPQITTHLTTLWKDL